MIYSQKLLFNTFFFKFCLFISFLLLYFLPTLSLAQTIINTTSEHSINIPKSKIIFFAKQSSVEVTGEFKKFSGMINFNSNNLPSSSVQVTIPIESLYIGGFENEMMTEPWFHKSKFPNISFSSTSITKSTNGFLLIGQLKIKDISSEVKIPISFSQEGNTTFIAGEFIVKRADFKVGTGEWSDLNMVANDVKLKFKIVIDK